MVETHLRNKYYNNEGIKVNNICSTFKFTSSDELSINNITNIMVENIQYNNNAVKIGKGTYGFIYKFCNSENRDDYFVVKEYIDKSDYIIDKVISIILYNANKIHNLRFNIIESYWNNYNNITIMNGMESDLFNLIYHTNIFFYDPTDIFKQVSRSIIDLYNKGIYYCDLKSSNILININDDNIKCVLGDIGGMFFRKDSLISNILSSNALDNEYIILKPYSGFENCCLIGFESFSRYKYVGYSLVSPELAIESKKSRKFKVNFMDNKKIKLVSELGNKFYVDSLNLNLNTAIFTYPHINNYSGLIEFEPDFDVKTIDKILLNNIIQSLGVFLLELLFQSYFNFTHEFVKTGFSRNKEKVFRRIQSNNLLSVDKKILLKQILFGSSEFSGLINDNYINIDNFERYIENIIQKLEVFHDWSPIINK